MIKAFAFDSLDPRSRPLSHPVAVILGVVAVMWSLVQLWIASPLPYWLHWGLINANEARHWHLAFGLALGFILYPAFSRSSLTLLDWLLSMMASFCALYGFLFYEQLAQRPGLPTVLDLVVGGVGLLLLLEATRRTLGWPLVTVALVFIGYALAGPWLPSIMAHGGISLERAITQYWLGDQGVFGVPLAVSASMVFLFVLFGALLEKAGAGNYFIQLAFAMLGHMRGGPAKAAVLSSATTGMISGSSIANVVTTGTFTIPLMKKIGFPAHKAAAVECASSVNGQMTPPVMGAAAFLMVEYVGVPYVTIVKAAALPAFIAYAALFYIVHLEAVKMNLQGLPRSKDWQPKPWMVRLALFCGGFALLTLLTALVVYGLGWIKPLLGSWNLPIMSGLLIAIYWLLVGYAERFPPLLAQPAADNLPIFSQVFGRGLYYLLPVVILIWCLAVEGLSPALSAFWAVLMLSFIILTQSAVQSFWQRQKNWYRQFNLQSLISAWAAGARNMIPIALATATAGLIVGTVTVTGLGLIMTELVEAISAGHLMLMLVMTAVICLILGMGLPTTANYIVVSTLMAPVIIALGAEQGLVLPLLAVHMFVFYYGILADDTPPVGLAAYAAAGIAGSEPLRTGMQSFAYDIRTAILPFMFIFNPQLLLIDVHSVFEVVWIVITALTAMLLFAAACQGYWLTRCRWYEVVGLLLVTLTLFQPGFWLDRLGYVDYQTVPLKQLPSLIKQTPANGYVTLRLQGMNLQGEMKNRTIALRLPAGDSFQQRLAKTGLSVLPMGNAWSVMSVNFGSQAQKLQIEFGWKIIAGQIAHPDRPSDAWLYLPAGILLAWIAWQQRRRLRCV